jgi:hypothetical protein
MKRERQRAATLSRQLQAARKELQSLKERSRTGNAGGPDTAEGDQGATPDPSIRRPRGRNQQNPSRQREVVSERPPDEARTSYDRPPSVWRWLGEPVE